MLVFPRKTKAEPFSDSACEYNIFDCRLLIFDLQISVTPIRRFCVIETNSFSAHQLLQFFYICIVLEQKICYEFYQNMPFDGFFHGVAQF